MDRNRVRSALRTLERQRDFLWEQNEFVPIALIDAIRELKECLRESDPADGCECDGCRAKVAEEASPESTDEFSIHISGPSDYEIRVKAFELSECLEFSSWSPSERLNNADAIYMWLIGQRKESTK